MTTTLSVGKYFDRLILCWNASTASAQRSRQSPALRPALPPLVSLQPHHLRGINEPAKSKSAEETGCRRSARFERPSKSSTRRETGRLIGTVGRFVPREVNAVTAVDGGRQDPGTHATAYIAHRQLAVAPTSTSNAAYPRRWRGQAAEAVYAGTQAPTAVDRSCINFVNAIALCLPCLRQQRLRVIGTTAQTPLLCRSTSNRRGKPAPAICCVCLRFYRAARQTRR